MPSDTLNDFKSDWYVLGKIRVEAGNSIITKHISQVFEETSVAVSSRRYEIVESPLFEKVVSQWFALEWNL